ncbi:MAG: sugar transferase [Bacteroidetes bacterium]|nr:sugar transferase [Bacteroidota bacterium]
MYKNYLKRLFDLLISFFVFIITLPLLLVVIFSLFMANSGKVFFVQSRPGKDEKIFNIIKFKTMKENKDVDGNLLPDEKRLTTIGKLIRKLSIDELPQLLNVIKGDMSLIGPRPLLIEYLPLYNEKQKRRHEVKPGITGWAQVNGRNAISWKEKFDLDVWYVDNISFLVDIKIIILTIAKTLKREGINSQGMATAPKFNGKN